MSERYRLCSNCIAKQLQSKRRRSKRRAKTAKLLKRIVVFWSMIWLKKWDAKLVALEGGKKAKVKKEDASPKKGGKVEKTNKTADSDKMELDLQIIPISHYFPMTMLKKFKWAAQEEDGSDLSPNWVFVDDAESKIRDNMSSARRKGGAAADSDSDADEEEVNDRAEAQKAIAHARSAKPNGAKPTNNKQEDSSDDDAPLAAK